MKRTLFFASIFLLIGAGCFGIDQEPEVDLDSLKNEIEVIELEESQVVDDIEVTEEVEAVEEIEVGEVVEDVEESQEDALEPKLINMESVNFSFSPASITAMPGQEVQITFTKNTGVHTFAIDELGLDQSISEGGVITFTAPDTLGNVPFYCSTGSHRALGMEGVLVIQ